MIFCVIFLVVALPSNAIQKMCLNLICRSQSLRNTIEFLNVRLLFGCRVLCGVVSILDVFILCMCESESVSMSGLRVSTVCTYRVS